MTKFATFSLDGDPIAFYSDDIHGLRDDASTTIPAAAVEITDGQWQEFLTYPGARRWSGTAVVAYQPPAPALTLADIDAERDRRIQAGFTFEGKLYQAREQDLRNINGAVTGAALAKMQGADAGDLRWQGGDADFGWIAADNTIVPMDIVTVIGFGLAALAHVERLTMLGRSLKDRLAAGETLDIADDALWSL